MCISITMSPACRGKLTVITGPMFSGKTTRLIKEVQKASKGRRVILFKSEIDDRYSSSEVVSHDGISLPALILPRGQGCIKALSQAAKSYDVIAIDEAQFWAGTQGFSEALDGLASNSKQVYAATLNRDSDGDPFNVAKELMAYADRICLLSARCSKCGSRAGFSQRMKNGVETYGKGFLVAGSAAYEARCRRHFVWPSRA